MIAPDIEPDFAEAQLHHFTIQLRPEATAKELIWELSKLFPAKAATIQ